VKVSVAKIIGSKKAKIVVVFQCVKITVKVKSEIGFYTHIFSPVFAFLRSFIILLPLVRSIHLSLRRRLLQEGTDSI
jgi:hypothetical protein